ncbi:MAG: tyrosine-protein phosphatase [Lentisphaeria bacterium]|nr:tyrosine-protein phosphatase [Lentisphaeria bacterium]
MKKAKRSPEKLAVLQPRQGEEVSLQTDLQYRYANGKCIPPVYPDGWAEKISRADCTHPQPVTVRLKNPSGKKCTVLLAEDENFTHPKKLEAVRSGKFWNLFPGKEYFLKAVCGKEVSGVVRFRTAPGLPRFIHVQGVTNVRDLGGWKCGKDKKIRLGMIYRGAQQEKWGAMKGITSQGKKALNEDLKLKTILDLRWWNEGNKRQKKDVKNYVNLPILAYATWHGPTEISLGVFAEEQMKHVKEIFLLLAKKNVYPLYFHCQGGGDRTGTIAFLLETFLGMDLEQAEMEYEFSNLSTSGLRMRISEVWVKFMEKLDEFAPGKSIQEKVTNFLYQCGLKEETLDRVRENLLEPSK